MAENVPTSMLPPAAALAGDEAFPIVQGGASKKSTPLALRTLALNGGDLQRVPLRNFLAGVKVIPDTTYTLLDGDTGHMLVFTASSQVTITLPNSFDPGWNAAIVQAGTGRVVASLQAGASILSRSSFDRTAGQGAAISLVVLTNAGGVAQYLFQGDGALS